MESILGISPCYKTGGLRPLRQHPSRSAVLGPGRLHATGGYNTARRQLHSTSLSPTPQTDAGLRAVECLRENPDGSTAPKSGCQRFPFNNFTYCLTLFPKCFSSFDHSTCALSVSGQYLALEEIYLPFRAAFPNNSTRRKSFTWARAPAAYGILTLYDVLFQGT
uniref:Protein TAR1 n=1 Tax=Cacopsylla melanoneura TaxID=428564 RepID=A0A8D8QFM1_9HEMI